MELALYIDDNKNTLVTIILTKKMEGKMDKDLIKSYLVKEVRDTTKSKVNVDSTSSEEIAKVLIENRQAGIWYYYNRWVNGNYSFVLKSSAFSFYQAVPALFYFHNILKFKSVFSNNNCLAQSCIKEKTFQKDKI